MTVHLGVQLLPWLQTAIATTFLFLWRGRALRAEERLRKFGLSEED